VRSEPRPNVEVQPGWLNGIPPVGGISGAGGMAGWVKGDRSVVDEDVTGRIQWEVIIESHLHVR
jgi:hypothetical protein